MSTKTPGLIKGKYSHLGTQKDSFVLITESTNKKKSLSLSIH